MFLFDPLNKAESLHFNHIWMASFQIHCGGIQRQNCENIAMVQILNAPNSIPYFPLLLLKG